MFYIYTYRRKKLNIQLLIIFLIVTVIFSQSFSVVKIYAQEENASPETEQTSENSTEESAKEVNPEKSSKDDVSETSETKELAPKEEATKEPIQEENLISESVENSEPQVQETEIEVQSAASIQNEIESSSNTGENEIAPEEQSKEGTENPENSQAENSVAETANNSIATGDTQSVSVIVNEANTTIVSDNFSSTITTITGTQTDDINVLEAFETVLENPKTEVTKENETSIEINNEAQINNTATSQSDSGNNTASGAESSITTGDASAISGVVNVVNNTLIGNNWVFLVINVVGNWLGDLILPGDGLIATPATTPQSLDVNVTNDASIQNNLTSDANTGNNEAHNGTIQTGDAISISSSSTQANTTIVENNWLYFLVNKIDGTQSTGFEFDSEKNEDLASSQTKEISVDNKATITSTVNSIANTGKNIIMGNGLIKTGNAIAQATAMNIVNTTIIGNNWIFVVVNVLGNWGGKVVFAYPDLAISTKLSKDSVFPHETLDYEITLTNEGAADAKNVLINPSIPNSLEVVSDPIEMGFAELKPGESRTLKMTLVPFENSDSQTPVTISTKAATATKEPNVLNNETSSNLVINEIPEEETNPKLKISRSGNEISAAPGELVSYELEISNAGDTPLYNVIVEDAIRDQNNQRILTYKWPISIIEPDQKYLINYTLALADSAAGATYTSKASGEARTAENEKVRSSGASLLTRVSAPFVLSAQASTATSEEIAEVASASMENIEEKKPDSFPFLYWLGIIGSYAALVQGRNYYRRRRVAMH